MWVDGGKDEENRQRRDAWVGGGGGGGSESNKSCPLTALLFLTGAVFGALDLVFKIGSVVA